MSDIEYNKHFCAFIDIMGYKNMIDSVENGELDAATMINNLENIIKSCIDEHLGHFNRLHEDSDNKIEFDYIVFSDSIIISTRTIEVNDKAPKYTYSNVISDKYVNANFARAQSLMLLLADIQMLALEHNILFRGAVSIGNHYKSDKVMFSKALVKAYQAESSKAIYPRIIIDKGNDSDVFELYSFINGLVNNGFIIREGDDVFIDYIGRINSMRHLSPEYTEDRLLIHKKIIHENLLKYKDNSQILSKYIWMGFYHNYSCIYKEPKFQINMKDYIEFKPEFNKKIIIP